MTHVDALSRNPVAYHESNANEEGRIFDVLQVNAKDWIATIQSADDEVKQIKEILEHKEIECETNIRKNYKLKEGNVYKLTDDGPRWIVPRGVVAGTADES